MNGVVVAVAAAAAAGTALLVPDSAGRLLRVLPGPGSPRRGPDLPAWSRALLAWALRAPIAAAMAGVTGAVVAGPMAAAVAAAGAALLARSLSGSRRAKAQAATVAATSRAIAGLAAELRAGRTPTEALDAVAGAAPPAVARPLLAAARAAKLGADPAVALAEHAGQVPSMRRLAACWRVAARTGAGLAEVADALAADLASAARRRAEMTVEVAASRASAKLLAGLPLVGIALGISLGARPVHFLLHTAIGAAVLTVGLMFEVAGLFWTDRLIAKAEQPP